MKCFTLQPGCLTLENIQKLLLDKNMAIEVANDYYNKITHSSDYIKSISQQDKTVYGINTGFGALAHQRISESDLLNLQKNLVLSHACGVGDNLCDDIVRIILLLKINALAQGYSGVRPQVVDFLVQLYNNKIFPCIPEKGSVGASGDLAPLAHMAVVTIGEGSVRYAGVELSTQQALEQYNMTALELGPKEGLALLNGTQVSTAIAIYHFFSAENIFSSAVAAGAMTTDAICGSDTPFDNRIHALSKHPYQRVVAEILRKLLKGSAIRANHIHCKKVQDPYSVRCQPQVMGACLANLQYAKKLIHDELNTVSDNPLVFSEDNEVLSGGNFHAEYIAMASDVIALALAEITSISERRIAMLMDSEHSGLPSFLAKNPGLNSGFMIMHVTASACATENKTLAHPVVVESLPTSANKEDHVSMATQAARRLGAMIENAEVVIAIELLAACQGLDFHESMKTSASLKSVYDCVRLKVKSSDGDRMMAHDIVLVQELIKNKKIHVEILDNMFSHRFIQDATSVIVD